MGEEGEVGWRRRQRGRRFWVKRGRRRGRRPREGHIVMGVVRVVGAVGDEVGSWTGFKTQTSVM